MVTESRTFIWVLCGMLALAQAAAGSSLVMTPIPSEEKIEGATRRLVRFRGSDGLVQEQVNYMPPWPIIGSGDCASMLIPGTDATASIRWVRTREPLDLQSEEAILKWVRSALGPSASDLKIEPIVRDPLKLNGRPTVEVHVRYQVFGRPVEHSLLLAHRASADPEELFVFELQAKPAQFAALHQVFRASLYTVTGF